MRRTFGRNAIAAGASGRQTGRPADRQANRIRHRTKMPGIYLQCGKGLAAALVLCAITTPCHAQVYKCTDANGKTTYGDAACDSAAKPLKLPADPKADSTNPRVCEQLQDEKQRLAAEADRSAKRGAAESAEHMRQRDKVGKQYAARCVGISLSGPKPN
jgi:hypothetical protein